VESPCRDRSQSLGPVVQLVDQSKVVGSVRLFESTACRMVMVWAEVQDLRTTYSGADIHIDIFRNGTQKASEFSAWTIPSGGATGTLPGLLIALKPGACYYVKVYVGDPQPGTVTQTSPVCQ